MKCNISSLEQWLRIIIGIILLSLIILGPRTLWGYVGIVPLLTGIVGFCPLYKLFSISFFPLD